MITSWLSWLWLLHAKSANSKIETKLQWCHHCQVGEAFEVSQLFSLAISCCTRSGNGPSNWMNLHDIWISSHYFMFADWLSKRYLLQDNLKRLYIFLYITIIAIICSILKVYFAYLRIPNGVSILCPQAQALYPPPPPLFPAQGCRKANMQPSTVCLPLTFLVQMIALPCSYILLWKNRSPRGGTKGTYEDILGIAGVRYPGTLLSYECLTAQAQQRKSASSPSPFFFISLSACQNWDPASIISKPRG